MAEIIITRAISVRRYEDFAIDTDGLTAEQITALELIGDYGEIEEEGTLKIIDEICDDQQGNAIYEDHEDNLEPSERSVDFMWQEDR